MTTADRDPLTIAREVLETAHEDDTITVCSVPDNKTAALARAVIDQADALDRVREALRRLEGGHHLHGGTCTCGVRSDRARDLTEHLTGIVRAALNGETHA